MTKEYYKDFYAITLIALGTALELFNLPVEQFRACTVSAYALKWFPGRKTRDRKDEKYKNQSGG
jgi:hypothetical protein